MWYEPGLNEDGRRGAETVWAEAFSTCKYCCQTVRTGTLAIVTVIDVEIRVDGMEAATELVR